MKHYVYGNGESRKGFTVSNYDGISWGCNALYRDAVVDNLIVMDYGMQGEVYNSGYVKEHKCWFADFDPLPRDVVDTFKMDFAEDDIHEYGTDYGLAVINGSHNKGIGSGLHIIYTDPVNDQIETFDQPREWSAGNTAVHLACQNGATEVYMFGFDVSTYSEQLNNVYKGTENYLSAETDKKIPASDWKSQLYLTFREFSDIKFNWIGSDFGYITETKIMDCDNVNLITYDNIRL